MVYGGMGGGPRGDHNIVIQVDDWTSREGYIFKKRKNSFSQNYFFLLGVVNPVHNQLIRSMGEWVEVLWPNIPQYQWLVPKTKSVQKNLKHNFSFSQN